MTHALLRSCVDRNKIRTQNRSQSPPQISILVTLGYNGSHWSQQRPGGELCYISFCCPDPISSPVCEADQNEHLCTTLCLLTRSRMAATTGTQWRGKNLSAKSFQQLYPNQKLKMCPPLLRWIHHSRFSVLYVYILFLTIFYILFVFPWPHLTKNLASISAACVFKNNNNV